ncbi:indolepyruvate oxidoreductase subunit beta [Fusibacter tunisiensis]|uniref:Indolepyruvate ferredoxin oxidoreductase beta subunit n=1 Tax=Fusibacter tunisiensis TaxID=1008308 RepID=A0ABS2MS91_9FIRM|nr:indolepyruvate oxidoreductase subunit beta [Fusibacter tunisiensis]MBM7562263.1 indolepyruvate ferredoxin oxidoreductase beta subunit [Fusibacter tunisiensis]
MSDNKNILLCGVGGQGIILASKILATGLIKAGYDVKMSEVHGMAQRGGSVTTQVRYGEKVHSPIIGKGQADVLVSFETMETSRWLEYIKPEGHVVMNAYQIPSAPILTGAVNYPKGVIEDISGKLKTTVFKAAELAEELGNVKTMNVIVVGALLKAMDLQDVVNWEEVIKETVKEKFIDINIKALKLGMAQV